MTLRAVYIQNKTVYLCHCDFHEHEVVNGLWSMTFMTFDKDLFFRVKETWVFWNLAHKIMYKSDK